jgi:hypothetical protein
VGQSVQWTLKSGGTVIDLPSGPLTVAGGLEYRSESLIQGNDINSEFNNITSPDFAGHLLSARRYIKSAYGEVDLPLAGEKWSWPGLRNIDVVFSERYDNYSDFGGTEKPKIAVRYKPFEFAWITERRSRIVRIRCEVSARSVAQARCLRYLVVK